MSRRRAKTKTVDAEQLEVRQLLTGDVTAVLQNNILTINEAPGHVGEASSIQISQLANGKIRVAAYGFNTPVSKVNGNPSADFTPAAGTPLSVVTNLGGGNDRLVIANNTKLNAATLNVGSTGNDIDVVDIKGLTTKGSLTINTGADVDTVNMDNFHIGDGIGTDDLTINTGKGRDTLNIGTLNNWSEVKGSFKAYTYEAADRETDVVNVNLLTVTKNIELYTGNGEDTVNMLATTAGLDIKITTGDDLDKVTIRETQALDEFFVDLGAGDDSLDLNFVRANWFKALGGAGVDRLSIQNPSQTLIQFEDFSFLNGNKLLPNLPVVLRPPLRRV